MQGVKNKNLSKTQWLGRKLISPMKPKIFFQKLIALLSLLCLSLTAYSQTFTLSLIVKDLDTSLPLENAEVIISKCSCGGITNSKGVFTIDLPKNNYRATISYIGYQKEIVDIRLDKTLTITTALKEQQEELSEVILRAKSMNDNLLLPQMGVVGLSQREAKLIPAAAGEYDVLRSLTLLPGINNAGEISNGLSIRGGSLDQNLILYDYAPIFNPTHLFGLFSVFTPDAIATSEMYRANIPAKYGGRSTSVLDIKVKNPYVSKLKLSGGIGLVSSKLNIEAPLIKDKLTILAAGRLGFTDFLLPIFSERLKNTKASFSDGTVKLLYLPSQNDILSFTGFFSNDFYQLDLVTQVQNINAENNQYDFTTLNGTLNWTHSFGALKNLRTVLVASDYTPRILFPERNINNTVRYESSIQYLSLFSEYSETLSDAFNYYFGLQANKFRISPGLLDPGNSQKVLGVNLEKEASYEFSTYANINWEPSDKISISTGLRVNQFLLRGPFTENNFDSFTGQLESTVTYNKNEIVKNYTHFEPRIGVNLVLNENTSLKASYARLNQYLQNIYNSNTPLPTSRWKTSDNQIVPQKSDSYGLGLYKTYDDLFEFSIESYYREVQNTLTYKPGANFFLGNTINRDVVQGQGRAYGMELSMKKPSGNINGWLNYTWSKSLLRSNVSKLSDRINNNKWYNSDFDRPHVLNATINFESDSYNTWSFNFTGQTGRPYSAANGVINIEGMDTPLFLERNNARLPVYHRLDFSWNIVGTNREEKRWKGDWTFTIYNVYARRNPYSIYYTQRNGMENSEIFLNNPLGAFELSVLNSPLFSLSYNFVFQ